ncbi:MAG TPA: hypothetical protein H9700_11525 [Candidatus Eisenbergiella intestinipullorum]|nr:hypothetical protein [Candidatus Eisenbergiella intestinipullorum]
MKKQDKRLRVGVIPTRREAFENETTTRQKEAVMERFRQLSEELDFELTDIEDINEEGLLMTYRDAKAAYEKLSAAGVDGLIFPHCNFGQEEAVGRLAKDMNVPVLIWGPRDGWPNGLEWRPTDAQCGMFATTKLLMHYGVKYSYIENCETDSEVLKDGLADFLAVCSVVKAFRSLRIARISTRPKEFLSVMVNEAELLEKYDIELVPGEPTSILHRVDRILENGRERMEALLRELTEAGLSIDALGEKRYPLAAIELALMDFAGEHDCNAISCECWSMFQRKYGISPCFVLGDLNDRGLPAACENDVHAAVTSVMAVAAARYRTPSFVADLTIRHPENDNAELLWHCGSFAKRLKKKGVPGRIVETGKGFYELEGGAVTILRFDGLNGDYYLFAGEGKGVDGPVTNGNYLWVEVDDWVKWEKKFMFGPYIHHVVGIHGNYASILREACRYLGIRFDFPDRPNEYGKQG